MAYSKEMIEWLHDTGKMPDWAYFQQNGKTAQQNYAEATRRARERILQHYNEEKERARIKEEEKKLQKELEKQIEEQAEETIGRVLEELLKGFSQK